METTKETQTNLKPIKTIAGEVLLYLYWMQRQDAGDLKNIRLNFGMFGFRTPLSNLTGVRLDRRDNSIFNIEQFKNYTDNDLYNALVYLYDSALLDFKDSRDNTGSNFFNLKLTAHGIDLIEGIERGAEEKRQFNVTFNFNINNDVTVESLLKAEFGSLIKASLM